MATQSVRIGWRPYVNVVTQVVNAVDADATAFISAAGITNLTQAAAINTLVNDLKTYGLWTKMKAIYPFVGGSATTHKFNLKDPRDLDAAFRLVFNGGWAHSSTGAKPNGTTGYANTFLNESIILLNNNSHLSVYSRTDLDSTSCDIGVTIGAVESNIYSKIGSIFYPRIQANNGGVNVGIVSSQAFYLSNRVNESQVFGYRNTTKYIVSSNSLGRINNVFYLASNHRDGTPQHLSSREQAFASIGDGLTDTEAINFYNSIQKFQTTLGRQIGSPIVSDSDAQAFLNAAGITDLGQATAINTLVTDLKSAGVWNKMKALYPFVGGTATTHKFNLKDPRDLDVAFRLTFTGGWTHTSTGALPNGSNGYANTFFVPSNNFPITQYDAHISLYSRTNVEAPTTNWLSGTIGVDDDYNSGAYFVLNVNSKTSRIVQGRTLGNQWATYSGPLDDSRGFFMINKQSNTSLKLTKNSTLLASNTTLSTVQYRPAQRFYIGAVNGSQSYSGLNYDNKEYAFITIGDGLTDTQSLAFYNAVQKYQTSLGRQIGTPVLESGQTANLLETYSGASAAYSLRKLRTTYYGFAIRVRRSSDNTEQDIAFDTNGGLDTTSLLAFVGNGNGFVTTWYDQSGSGVHISQSTAANQPQIVSTGSIMTKNNKPTIDFTSGQFLRADKKVIGTTATSVFNVFSIKSLTSRVFAWDIGNNVLNQYYAFDINTYFTSGQKFGFYSNTFSADSTASTNLNQNLMSVVSNNTSGNSIASNTWYYINNVQRSLTSTFGGGTQTYPNFTGATRITVGNLNFENFYFSGTHQEIIFYPTNQSTNLSGIHTNINSYYSVY
jgi:hypothetical protein